MKIITTFIIAAFVLAGTSCKKFLAAYSQNETFIQSVEDLEEVLIGEVYLGGGSHWGSLAFMDDDASHNPGALMRINAFDQFGIHFWQQVPERRSDGLSYVAYNNTYLKLYKLIADLNTILYNIPLLREKNASEEKLRKISGEAHLLRAYYYFILVNVYGKPFRAASAAADYGVPLKIAPEVQDAPFERASVQQVYDQIERDLLEAEKELNGFNETAVLRVNQATAQALLSRIYLYQENYEKAVTYADKVIAKRYKLRDMNSWPSGTAFVNQASPELIYSAVPGSVTENKMLDISVYYEIESYSVSNELLGIYSSKDLRLPAFFKATGTGDLVARKCGEKEKVEVADMASIRLPELYLNKAEALAILNKDAEAIHTLQELRKNRFKPEDLTDITVSGAALVDFIRNERRRELCFEFHRWFDLRRYGVNNKYPFGKITRHNSYQYDGSGRYLEGYYELKPYAEEPAAYVLPISIKEIEFGQGVISNEPRPERPLLH
ncbi:RagB/SusD family nutrient uptake outer membrane protein [Pseudoflavitalea sp. G-6-1-2]|uniref:RagB/SusD family nutrient uptake outer membrane protein n=1 Tax=Pseudoflavitalea sp. G-6-1-2 TaxID=2728841 RepID=UPI00146B8443|nr:RagB/SusD family nutrient uptake outer membrane protein [Pseudoflavitalea sp. G-6-1-2]NML21167.1 RagB/SusD family nutrient uptake outer membrane protein [Pseudoflavitalea sp. G-6-1-2]